MFIRFAFLFIFLSAFTSVTPINLIQQSGQPSPALLKLFDALDLKNDGTICQLNQIAQEQWLRKPNQERWEMTDTHHDKINVVHPILLELGVIHEILPIGKIYDCVIIHGATVDTMRKRLQFLDKLWHKGLWARKIIFLTGQRPLDPSRENASVLFEQNHSPVPFRPRWTRPHKMPNTESAAAALVWDQTITHPDLRSRKPYIVAAPMMRDPKTGALKRPNTADSIRAWIESGLLLPEGKCLAISNNPYIPYQDQTLRRILRRRGFLAHDIALETVGPAANKDTSIATHLDNIARWLYAEINVCHRVSRSSETD